jgi:isoleucyl-tRNA synthetase
VTSHVNKLTSGQDVVTRYAHATGHHVERRFGWDTHGLPVEREIDKKLGITSKQDVMNIGIANYNAECRAIVMRYASEWRMTVERMGRWIDFDNDYKTLNVTFMESVWWVFKQLWDKGLVYRGLRVMPYSTALTTPLSNFEAGSAYKEVSDPAGACAWSTPRARFTSCRSHRRLSPRRRPLDRLSRLDDHALDPALQPRALRPPRL